MADWPATLPDYVLVQGYEEQFPATLLRTDMDAGPAKVRRRFTAGVRPFRVEFDLDSTQTAALDTFVMDTLAGGSLPFDWTHPRTGASVSFRIVASRSDPPVTLTALGGDYYRASMALEVLP